MAQTSVRPLEASDFDAWLPLWRGYQAFYKTDIPIETTRATWARFLDPAEPVFGALAIVDDRAVGMVHWIMHRSCWTVGDYCYLQDLFVDPAVRGHGAGRQADRARLRPGQGSSVFACLVADPRDQHRCDAAL